MEVGGSCKPEVLGSTVKEARDPAAEVSTGGGFVLAEASPNFEAMS